MTSFISHLSSFVPWNEYSRLLNSTNLRSQAVIRLCIEYTRADQRFVFQRIATRAITVLCLFRTKYGFIINLINAVRSCWNELVNVSIKRFEKDAFRLSDYSIECDNFEYKLDGNAGLENETKVYIIGIVKNVGIWKMSSAVFRRARRKLARVGEEYLLRRVNKAGLIRGWLKR